MFTAGKFPDKINYIESLPCSLNKYNSYIGTIELIGDKNNLDRWFPVIPSIQLKTLIVLKMDPNA